MGTKRISELSTAVREREFIASLLDWMQQNPEGFVGHPGVDFTRRNKLSLRDMCFCNRKSAKIPKEFSTFSKTSIYLLFNHLMVHR